MTVIPTKPAFSARAHVRSLARYEQIYAESILDRERFWQNEIGTLEWDQLPAEIVDDRTPGEAEWFAGGRMNVAVNCVDRHARTRPNEVAVIWAKNEPGEYERISFAELGRRVGRMGNLLRELGVRRGDRVCLYLPMIPELVVAMLACARIGAVHSVVFAGFSAQALRERIVDAGAELLITCDEGLRGLKRVPLKAIADEAVEGLAQVRTVLVAQRTGRDVPMRSGRDQLLNEQLAKHRSSCPPESMDSEDPLFLLYTSGSTGKPKGLVHSTAGYLAWAALTHRYVFDIHPGDVHFCAADIGWITGHSYIVYGPLANGTTTVLFESLPTYPDASRLWRVVEDLRATNIYTSPTALRALMREGDEPVRRHDRSSLRLLGSVGEPINPEVWRWFHDVVGEGRAPVVDTWWQTETGGILISPLPGATPCKPGSATLPLFGVRPVLLDAQGRRIDDDEVEGDREGNLCIEGSWPGQARTIFGDHARYLDTYFRPFPGFYFTGDGCRRDSDGYYWITGRVDDVINVSGHRLGTAEIESALVAHEVVVEAAVVPIPHDLKGQSICAFVITNEKADPELVFALKEQVRRAIGPIAVPDTIHVVDALPKTRSGKIMRRILRQLASGQHTGLGDLSTLADEGAVAQLISQLNP